MTFDDFKKTIKKETIIDRNGHLAGNLFLMAIGFFLIYCALTGRGEKQQHQPYLFYIGSCCCLLMSGYGLYKIPNRYKIITMPSNLSLSSKGLVIEQLLGKYNSRNLSKERPYCFFIIQKSRWKIAYWVYLFFDNSRFAFSVQGMSFGGHIDFGQTEKIRKELADLIEALIVGKNTMVNSN